MYNQFTYYKLKKEKFGLSVGASIEKKKRI